MKKHLLTIIITLIGIALNAQVSVWDGSYEPYDTIHAGTEDDPILIENAAQLAYMSQLIYCSQDPKYYKLTTDIDIDHKPWCPIGYNGTSCPEFNGYFDGDNHTIYNPSNTLFYDTYDGYIKNITTRGSMVYLEHEYISFGLITYWAPLVENCHNYCDIIINANYRMKAGGIAAVGGSIVNCSNHGTITINADYLGYCFVGGISGQASFLEECYNTGDINIEIANCNNCKIGGVSGIIFNEFSNSYNIGNIIVNCENAYAGGIAGDITDNYHVPSHDVYMSSCYNSGIINATNISGIIAYADYENVTTYVNNCYYINTIESINDYGIPKSESEMKTQEFVDVLNDGGDVYAMDLLHANGGFPIFSRYTGIGENESMENITVYPNPANDHIQIILSDDSSLQSVEIYTIDGRLVVETFPETSYQTTIDISGLHSGMYIMKLRMADGKEFSEKIVKE